MNAKEPISVVVAALDRVVHGLAMTPVPIADDLAELVGELRGHAVLMSTRRYAGRDRELTIATIAGAEDHHALTVTAVGLPADGTGLPILGLDLIGLRGQGMPLVAIDLAPTCADRWQRSARPVLEAVAELAGALTRRRPPRFAAGVFSPLALIAGARADQVEIACAAAVTAVEAWAELSPGAGHATATMVERWCAAELDNRKEHDALSAIFGAEIATHYLRGFLFARGAGGAGATARAAGSRALEVAA